ncbi:MAG TPA: DNA polymerase III subunit gamma/tau [Candidatus Paceibacterota bacterium]|nr:DNA polymerase III subunit gamma/tau [Candidatus Paceibacterota bacterium]
MAHQSLYRVYRPQSFKEVIGQDQVVGPLTEQIASGKVAHAYLFSGSRGLGKTSIARIFARELKTDERDIVELDAASNNKVENVRELNESVFTLPFNSERKVYILDEVHMLSTGAWNALLKTLEEPPAHVIFILATTELEKVPETVRSRCQVFTFKKPSRQGLSELVLSVAKKEGYTVEPAAADLIALLGDGSYRDALSVLEKALASSSDKKLTREETEKATGAPRHALVHAFVEALSRGNAEGALATVRTATEQGIDMQLYLSLVLEYVRQVLLLRHAPELKKEIVSELGDDASGEALALAEDKGSKLSHETLKLLLDAAQRMRFSPLPALPLELAVLEHQAV